MGTNQTLKDIIILCLATYAVYAAYVVLTNGWMFFTTIFKRKK